MDKDKIISPVRALVFPEEDEAPKKKRETRAKKSPTKTPVKRATPGKKRISRVGPKSGPIMDDLELTSPEKQNAQALGVALRNLLKLPKAHKWVCYEFFYSNIDKYDLFVVFLRQFKIP